MAMKYTAKWFYNGPERRIVYRRMRVGGAGVNGKWQWFGLTVESRRIVQLGSDGCASLNLAAGKGLLIPSDIEDPLPRSSFNGLLYNEIDLTAKRKAQSERQRTKTAS